MKIYDLRKKDGTPIVPKIHERNIMAYGDDLLMDKLHYISRDMSILENNTPNVFQPYYKSITDGDPFFNKYHWKPKSGNKLYKKNTVVKHKGMWYLTTDRVSTNIPPSKKSWYFYQIDRGGEPICFLRDDGRTIISDYGYTYNDLSQMLINNDYGRYIKDNDYIELVVNDCIYTMRFNIDVYYDYLFDNPYTNNKATLNKCIPHHIDMISDEVMDVSTNQSINTNHPYLTKKIIDSLAGNKTTRDSDINNIYQEISMNNSWWNAYSNKLNPLLKSHIVQKYARVGDRSLSNKSKSIENRINIPIGYLWQPREPEIFGYPILSSPEYESVFCIQYPCFQKFGSARKLVQPYNDPKRPVPVPYITWSLGYNSDVPIIINEKGMPIKNKYPGNTSQLLCFRFV